MIQLNLKSIKNRNYDIRILKCAYKMIHLKNRCITYQIS